jgi:hypothetical protein
VLGRDLAWLDGMDRAKRPVRLPVVLSPLEADALLGHSDVSTTMIYKKSPGRARVFRRS